MRRLFGRKRGGRHAGLGIYFQYDQTVEALGVVPAKVSARDAPTAQRVMATFRQIKAGIGDILRDIRRHNVGRSAVFVFGVIILPAGV